MSSHVLHHSPHPHKGIQHTHHHSNSSKPKLFLVVLMNLIITFAEIIGGILSGSLALLSDAVHNLGDTLAVFFSYVAVKWSKKPPSIDHHYGYQRANILSAFINSAVLLCLSIYLTVESIKRFLNPNPIEGNIVVFVSIIGLVANLVSVFLLNSDSKNDLNIKSSYLHLMSDALSSIVVLVSGFFIQTFHCYWLDPISTVMINLIIFKSGYSVCKESVHILMQGVPKSINLESFKQEIESLEPVQQIQDMRVWQLDDHHHCMDLKIGVKDMLISETNDIKHEIEHIAKDHYGVKYLSIEFCTY